MNSFKKNNSRLSISLIYFQGQIVERLCLRFNLIPTVSLIELFNFYLMDPYKLLNAVLIFPIYSRK